MIKSVITAFILSLFILHASGQNPKIDSLTHLLSVNTQSDTARVNLLNTLAYELYNNNPKQAQSYVQESQKLATQLNYTKGEAAGLWVTGLISIRRDRREALDYFRKALTLAKQIGDKVGICNYLSAIGNITRELGDMQGSTDAHQHALQIAEQIDDKLLIIKVSINLSINASSIGNPVEAVRYLHQAIKLAELIDDQFRLAAAYGQLATIYQQQGSFSTALEYQFLALHINEKLGSQSGIFTNLINIAGFQSTQSDHPAALETIQKALRIAQQQNDSTQISACYTNFGNIYKQMNHPEALNYFQKAMTISRGKPVRQSINNLMNMGSIYTTQRAFDKAMKCFDEAQEIAKNTGNLRSLSAIYIYVGTAYLKQCKYDQAITSLKQALDLAKNTRHTELQKDSQKLLSDIYATTGDYKNAYTAHEQYRVLHDSIFNEKSTRQVALLESSYKFAKEREVYELEKTTHELHIKSQQQTIFSLIAISLLVLLLALAVYWSGRLRKKVLRLKIERINQELEANQKAMAIAKLKLVQNSERDAHNVKMLEEIGTNAAGESQKEINTVISNYKMQTCHSNWEEFETLFMKVNTSFWNKLNVQYPDLTPNERKLCVFLKLNMSNKDITQITFQSEEALKKSRLRLRQKFDIDRSTNLGAFIQSL